MHVVRAPFPFQYQPSLTFSVDRRSVGRKSPKDLSIVLCDRVLEGVGNLIQSQGTSLREGHSEIKNGKLNPVEK